MVRPRILRRIRFRCKSNYFKPAGIPIRRLKEIILRKDEMEAIRLADVDNIGQKKAAKMMKVSQPTFSRIIESAHKKVGEALVKGKAIRVEE